MNPLSTIATRSSKINIGLEIQSFLGAINLSQED